MYPTVSTRMIKSSFCILIASGPQTKSPHIPLVKKHITTTCYNKLSTCYKHNDVSGKLFQEEVKSFLTEKV